MADTWLEPSTVTAVLGSGVSEGLEADALAAIVPGVRSWVEDKRKDLVELTGDPPNPEFQASPHITLGAALLVYRIYDRRRTPAGLLGSSEDGYAGIIRDDPDIARFLGIGASSRFVFGAAPDPEPVEAV